MCPKEKAVRCVNILHECYDVTFGWQVWAPCDSRAHTRAVTCRRVCDRLTTAKLAIRADDCSLLLHCFGPPHVIVTDKLRSYGAAIKVIGSADKQETGRWLNNRAENSQQPFRRRERAMLRFRRTQSLQKLVAVHASITSTGSATFTHDQFQAQPNSRSC